MQLVFHGAKGHNIKYMYMCKYAGNLLAIRGNTIYNYLSNSLNKVCTVFNYSYGYFQNMNARTEPDNIHLVSIIIGIAFVRDRQETCVGDYSKKGESRLLAFLLNIQKWIVATSQPMAMRITFLLFMLLPLPTFSKSSLLFLLVHVHTNLTAQKQ